MVMRREGVTGRMGWTCRVEESTKPQGKLKWELQLKPNRGKILNVEATGKVLKVFD